MIFKCPICGIIAEMHPIEYNKKLIKLLYQWKEFSFGDITIDQLIKKLEQINKEEGLE
jgi:hypothetical protein